MSPSISWKQANSSTCGQHPALVLGTHRGTGEGIMVVGVMLASPVHGTMMPTTMAQHPHCLSRRRMGREARRLTSWPHAMVIPKVGQRCGAALSSPCEWEASHTAQLRGAVPGHFGTQHHAPEEPWSACDFFFSNLCHPDP